MKNKFITTVVATALALTMTFSLANGMDVKAAEITEDSLVAAEDTNVGNESVDIQQQEPVEISELETTENNDLSKSSESITVDESIAEDILATQHYQDSVITPYGNNHWNGKEKIDISKEKDDAVILEISAKGKRAIQLKEKNEFEQNIVQVDKSADDLPAYSGMYDVDKTISSSLENCSKEEQGFVYDIIRENFLIGNGSSMSEEERQANISLGMKKAEYAANNFISEDKKSSFLDAMESIAKLASAGKMNADGNMDYGVKKGNYLGHGSNLVYTTDGLDMMRSMDSGAYDEYQRISRESSNSDRQLNTLKYLTNWYSNAVTKNPHMVEKYEAKSDEYIEKNVKNQKVDSTFSDLKTESKSAFIESLKAFQAQNPNFLSNIVNKELSRKYWAYGIIA